MNLQKLAHRFGTPLYVYNLDIIRERMKDLQDTLGQNPHTEFFYAIKANFNPHIVRHIVEAGFGIDAVSLDEVKIALLCGTPKEKIMYTENNMTDEEMHETVRLGVLINIGSLSRLQKFGAVYAGSRVCVRFNPNVGAASHETNITGGPKSKFGISFQEIPEVQKIAKEYNLQVVGIHQHIGSGWLSLEEPLLALDVILDTAQHFPNLEFVDFGGGFGVPYQPQQTRLNLETLGEKIQQKFSLFCTKYGRNIMLRFEPGRHIVAESGHLLCEVNTIKQSPEGRNFAGTNTGMNHLVRVAMYGSYHPIENISNPQGEKKCTISLEIFVSAQTFLRKIVK